MKVSPREQVESPADRRPVRLRLRAAARNPPHAAADQPVLARLRGVGLIPGRPFDFDKLDHPAKQGMRRGLRAARRMQAAAGATLREANGWQREAGGVGVYGNAYMRRALAAQAQPGASLPEDLATLLLAADGRGEPWTARAAITCASPAASCRRPAPSGRWRPTTPRACWRQRAEPPGARQPRPAALQRGRLAGPGPRPRSARARAAVQLAAAAGLRTRAIAAARHQPGPALLDGLWTPPLLLLEAPSEATAEVARRRRRPRPTPIPRPRRARRPQPPPSPAPAATASSPAKPAAQGKASRSPCRAADWRGDPARRAAFPARRREQGPPPIRPRKDSGAPRQRYHIHFSNQERPTWTTPSATNCR